MIHGAEGHDKCRHGNTGTIGDSIIAIVTRTNEGEDS
jgi:hypothetical protein